MLKLFGAIQKSQKLIKTLNTAIRKLTNAPPHGSNFTLYTELKLKKMSQMFLNDFFNA